MNVLEAFWESGTTRRRAKALKSLTGLSLPVCTLITKWSRSEEGALFSAYEREGKVPKLLRRARRALVVTSLEKRPDERTGRFLVKAVGPVGEVLLSSSYE